MAILSYFYTLFADRIQIAESTDRKNNRENLLKERSLENPTLKIWLEKRKNWLSGNIQNLMPPLKSVFFS